MNTYSHTLYRPTAKVRYEKHLPREVGISDFVDVHNVTYYITPHTPRLLKMSIVTFATAMFTGFLDIL